MQDVNSGSGQPCVGIQWHRAAETGKASGSTLQNGHAAHKVVDDDDGEHRHRDTPRIYKHSSDGRRRRHQDGQEVDLPLRPPHPPYNRGNGRSQEMGVTAV